MYLKIHIKYIKLCLKEETVDNTVFFIEKKKTICYSNKSRN